MLLGSLTSNLAASTLQTQLRTITMAIRKGLQETSDLTRQKASLDKDSPNYQADVAKIDCSLAELDEWGNDLEVEKETIETQIAYEKANQEAEQKESENFRNGIFGKGIG